MTDTPAPPTKLAGRMQVDFLDHGLGNSLEPVISFHPVGRITEGLIDRHMPLIFQRIRQAQVEAQREQSQSASADPPRRSRR